MGKQNYFFMRNYGHTDSCHFVWAWQLCVWNVKILKRKTNGCLSISQNTVYAVTYKLVNERKISEYQGCRQKRTRIYYHIEDEGRAYYENLLESFHNALQRCREHFKYFKRGQGQWTITGIPYVVKKIRTGKYIKRLIAVVLILALISTVTYCIVLAWRPSDYKKTGSCYSRRCNRIV